MVYHPCIQLHIRAHLTHPTTTAQDPARLIKTTSRCRDQDAVSNFLVAHSAADANDRPRSVVKSL